MIVFAVIELARGMKSDSLPLAVANWAHQHFEELPQFLKNC